jgi:hypothetical protein
MSTKLDQELKNYYRQFDASQDRLRGRLVKYLNFDEKPTVGLISDPARKSRLLVRLIWPSSALAAAVLIAVGLWFVAAGSPRSLYAQALRAIEQARTIHIMAYRFEEGRPRKEAEVWYDKDRGVLEVEGLQVGSGAVKGHMRLDNGTHQWLLNSKTETVIKTASVDPKGVVIDVLRPERVLKACAREPALDCTIGDERCRAYAKIIEREDARNPRFRECAWIDSKGRMRRFEEHVFNNGRWEKDELVEVGFDVAIDPKRFEPSFGPGLRVIDNTTQEQLDLARFLAPEEALFTHQQLGLVLAVHEVARVDEDMVLIVHSVQPTRQTLEELGSIQNRRDGAKRYGDSQLDSSFEWIDRKQNIWQSYQPLRLAHATYNGIEIQWSLLIEKGEWSKPAEHCDLGVYIYARAELQESLLREGRQWYARREHLARLPLEHKISLKQALARVHADALSMEAVCSRWIHLNRDSRPLTEQEKQERIDGGNSADDAGKMTVVPTIRPSLIGADEFEKDIRSRIGKLRRM